jgi:hypothetical protein
MMPSIADGFDMSACRLIRYRYAGVAGDPVRLKLRLRKTRCRDQVSGAAGIMVLSSAILPGRLGSVYYQISDR